MLDPTRQYDEAELAEYLRQEHEAFWWSRERSYKPISEVLIDWFDEHPMLCKLIIFVALIAIALVAFNVDWVGTFCMLALVFGLLGLCAWAIVSIIYDAIHDWLI